MILLVRPLAYSFIPWVLILSSAVVAQGNHEQDWSGTGTVNPNSGALLGRDSGGECGIPTATRFIMPCVTLANGDGGDGGDDGGYRDDPTKPAARYAYSFEQGPVHFTMINTELDINGEQFPQFHWLEQDLQAVNRTLTPWVVVMGHRPMWPRPTRAGTHLGW